MSIAERILFTQPANLLGFWRLNDASGASTVVDSSDNGYDATPYNVTFAGDTGPDWQPAATFNGTSSYIDLDDAGLLAAASGAELTLLMWIKPDSWSETATRMSARFTADLDNSFLIRRNGANTLSWFSKSGGTTKEITKSSLSPTDWVCATLTVSETADEVKAYYNDELVDTLTGLGTFAGAITAAEIGSNTLGSAFWDGGIALVALWDTALDADQVGFISGQIFTTPDAAIRVYLDADRDGFTSGDLITTDVRGGSAQIGILDQESRTAEVGQLTLTVDNSTRKYTPNNSSSSLYGKLVPRTPIKVTGVAGAGEVDLWTGKIVSVEPTSQRYGDRYATITAQCLLREFQDVRDITIPLQTDAAADDLLKLVDAAVFQTAVASGTIKITDLPEAGDVITIGNKSYTLVSGSLPTTDGEVALFTDRYNAYAAASASDYYYVDDTVENLVNAINNDNGYPNIGGNYTAYAAATPRHTQVTASYDHLGLGWGSVNLTGYKVLYDLTDAFEKLACRATLTGDTIENVETVGLFLQKAGTPPGTLTLRAESIGGDGFPTGELIDANATATLSESSVGTSFAMVQFTFADAITLTPDVALVLSTDSGIAGASQIRWAIDGAQGSDRGDGFTYTTAGGWVDQAWNMIFWFASTITIEANARGVWGNSLGLSTDSLHYNATTENVNTGTEISTDISYTYYRDGTLYNVQEVTGTPGFDVEFTFDITGTGQTLELYGRYQGNVGHTVNVQAYDGTTWDTLNTLVHATSNAEYSYTLNAEHTISGTVTVRFYHATAGNATHNLYIDHLYVISDTADGAAETITLSGATLAGGAQPTAFTASYQDGAQEFAYAGDSWNEGVNAMTVINEIADSEAGLYAIDRSGNPVFKNTNYWFAAHTQTRVTLDNTQADLSARYSIDDIRNQFMIEYRARTIVENVKIGTGPRAFKLLPSPSTYDGGRWSLTGTKQGASYARTFTISTVNGETGEPAGVYAVDPPVRGEHYSIYTKLRKELGEEIEQDNIVKWSWAIKGAGVETTAFNTSNRKIFIHDLYLDGDILDWSQLVQLYAEDTTSISAYGLAPGSYTLWLPTTEEFAQALGDYLVTLYKDPRTIIQTVRYNLLEYAGATHLFDIDLFDVVDLDEYQWVIDTGAMVMGINYEFDAEQVTAVTFYVRQLDPYSYGIWDDATYGLWDTAAWAL